MRNKFSIVCGEGFTVPLAQPNYKASVYLQEHKNIADVHWHEQI